MFRSPPFWVNENIKPCLRTQEEVEKRYNQCMLENPNTGRFQTGSVGPLDSHTNAGWGLALSKVDFAQVQPQPWLTKNICTEWMGPERILKASTVKDIQKSDPLRDPKFPRFSRDPNDLTQTTPRPVQFFAFS